MHCKEGERGVRQMIENILMANHHQIYNRHVEAIMEGKGLCHLYSHAYVLLA